MASKILFLQIFILGGVCKFPCEICNKSDYREFIRQLAVKSGAHIGIRLLLFHLQLIKGYN